MYVQNSAIEFAWRSTVENTGTIAGTKIIPFFTEYPEGFAIDYEDDWVTAERLAQRLLVTA